MSELHASAELELYKAFFDAWEGLHEIPNDKLHRGKKEAAAQLLVDRCHSIRRFREPLQVTKILGIENG